MGSESTERHGAWSIATGAAILSNDQRSEPPSPEVRDCFVARFSTGVSNLSSSQ